MFKVLIVDDEPIILTGIKFLIDWESIDCELIDTAKNGKEAFKKIEMLQPDIVIADINMPVMNGIELLEKTYEKYPYIVFIMLTNLEEFELVQKAIQLRVIDYIVKIRLKAEKLIEVIEIAKKKSLERKKINQINLTNIIIHDQKKELLKNSLQSLVFLNRYEKELLTPLEKEIGNNYYGFIEIFLPNKYDDTQKNITKTFNWLVELTKNLAENILKDFIIIKKNCICYIFLIEENEKIFSNKILLFYEKLISLTKDIIGQKPHFISTNSFANKNYLLNSIKELGNLETQFYNFPENIINKKSFKIQEVSYLPINGFENRFKYTVNNRDTKGSINLIEKLIKNIKEIFHEKEQGQWICNEILNIANKSIDINSYSYLENTSLRYYEISNFKNKYQIIDWLENFKIQIEKMVLPVSPHCSRIIDDVKDYVNNNINKKITLNDVAKHISISPSYLSALFKEEYGQNFIDYVNETKIKKACKLIENSDYLINEIGFELGFENPYYFSKVFRKHLNLSPTEYRNRNYKKP